MKNNILTGLQVLLVIIWVVSGYIFNGDINLFVFNILPIPNFGLVIITFVLIMIGYWLQKLKNNK